MVEFVVKNHQAVVQALQKILEVVKFDGEAYTLCSPFI